jgi:hypothetical protein
MEHSDLIVIYDCDAFWSGWLTTKKKKYGKQRQPVNIFHGAIIYEAEGFRCVL